MENNRNAEEVHKNNVQALIVVSEQGFGKLDDEATVGERLYIRFKNGSTIKATPHDKSIKGYDLKAVMPEQNNIIIGGRSLGRRAKWFEVFDKIVDFKQTLINNKIPIK